MLLKNIITDCDRDDIEIIMELWEIYRNSIRITLSDSVQHYGIRGLNYEGIKHNDYIPDIHYDYFEDSDWLHHYIANLPNWKVKDFCWNTIDEAWEKCSRYFSGLHDSRIAPDGKTWDVNRFLLDALSWELHWWYLQQLNWLKNKIPYKTKYASSYFNPLKNHKHKKRHR